MDIRKKNIIVRMIIGLAGIMLAFGIATGISGTSVVGAKAAEKKAETKQQSSKPTKKEVRALTKKVVKANKIARYLKKHKSVNVVTDMQVLWFSKKASYTRTPRNAVYADNNGAYNLNWDTKTFKYCFIVDNNIDKFDMTNARYFIDKAFTKEEILSEETVSIEYTDDLIIWTRLLSEESTEKLLESYGLTDMTDPLYEVLELDRNTYEAGCIYLYAKEPGNILIGKEQFFYDVEEPVECTMLRGMGERNAKQTVNCTIIRDAGTENEIRVEKTIPAGSNFSMYARGIDGQKYADPECTEPSGEWDGLSDTVIYLKTASETAE